MWKEFKEFAIKGNMVDLAIGVIIGGAFGKVVTSIVNDMVMPPIGLLLGRVNFSNLFISLDGKTYETLEKANAAGAPTLNYGLFINNLLDFFIIAFVIFVVVKQMNKLRKQKEEKKAETPREMKECPQCLSEIPAKAVRCRYCTSEVAEDTQRAV